MEQEKNTQPTYTPATPRRRVAAWLGVLGMVALTLLFAYSIATGAIFAW